ncbi:MAG: GIY-YIG nuclease family protein [Bacteroidales bacterium]
MELDKEVLDKIKTKRKLDKSFFDIVNGFETLFDRINYKEKSFSIKEYFGKDSGVASAREKLLRENIIKPEWLETSSTKKDFKGLYIFLHDKEPFYVGISKGVLQRICQHIKGHNHNTSTLAYNISLLQYEFREKKTFKGKRNELNFKTEVEPIKDFLLNQEIAFIPIENDEELYLFEVFCSMKLRTFLNKFETH